MKRQDEMNTFGIAKYVAGTLLLAGGASLPACGAEIGNDEVNQTQDPLYITSSRLWPSREIPVC